jgi:hypothetical protein
MLGYVLQIGEGQNPLLEQPPPTPPDPLGRMQQSRQDDPAVVSLVNPLVSRAS